ncbi:MAG: hypothetical protein OXH84_00355 [Gammaproteobacteria bacterium]|nr:hypothetical protein [Gammaproteobacteria bacterium]
MNEQLRINAKAYEAVRVDMEANNLGRVALLSDGKVINVYNDSGDAYSIGVERFG